MKVKENKKKRLKWLVFVLALCGALAVIMTRTEVHNRVPKYLYPLKYKEFVLKFSDIYNVDPYLVFAIVHEESSFNPDKTSRSGAIGLMQLLPSTAYMEARYLKLSGITIKDIYKPEINIRLGVQHVARMLRRFDGNTQLAVAAYNGGEGNVSKWIKNNSIVWVDGDIRELPFKETEHYVIEVMYTSKVYKTIYPNIAQ